MPSDKTPQIAPSGMDNPPAPDGNAGGFKSLSKNKQYAVVGGGFIALAGAIYLWEKHKSSSATSTATGQVIAIPTSSQAVNPYPNPSPNSGPGWGSFPGWPNQPIPVQATGTGTGSATPTPLPPPITSTTAPTTYAPNTTGGQALLASLPAGQGLGPANYEPTAAFSTPLDADAYAMANSPNGIQLVNGVSYIVNPDGSLGAPV